MCSCICEKNCCVKVFLLKVFNVLFYIGIAELHFLQVCLKKIVSLYGFISKIEGCFFYRSVGGKPVSVKSFDLMEERKKLKLGNNFRHNQLKVNILCKVHWNMSFSNN